MYLPVLMVTGVITVILFWPLSPMLGVRSGPSIALVPIRSPIPVHTCTQTSVLITDGDRVERGRGGGSRRYIYIYTSNYYHKGNAVWVRAYESLRLLLNTKRKMVDIVTPGYLHLQQKLAHIFQMGVVCDMNLLNESQKL